MSKVTKVEKSKVKKFNSVPIANIKMGKSLLESRRLVNQKHSLPHQYQECERTGRIENFKIAAGLKEGEISKHLAPDSDVYKWLEGVAWVLANGEDANLKGKADELIELIAEAQESSGYLNTSFLREKKNQRWRDLNNGHELYCGGHLIQAALANFRCTGNDQLLTVARKWADCICDYFGPEAHSGTAGHSEIEMALVELYRETGEVRYLNLAEYFIEQRGKGLLDGTQGKQDHCLIREQTTVDGHAVRQLYLTAGVSDLYAETRDESLFDTLQKQWYNFVGRRMAITGGAGSRYSGEAFGLDYEIPNRTGYYESCAAIASFMWNWRMLQITGKAEYADIMEQVLYNGILSAVSLDGMTYFYTNPLEHDGETSMGCSWQNKPCRGISQRTTTHWDGTACCPPNAARLLGSLPGYLYGVTDNELYIHHFVANRANLNIDNTEMEIHQETSYPWDGKAEITINPAQAIDFKLNLRIPGWVKDAEIKINDELINAEPRPGTYHVMNRQWRKGDRIELNFSMPVEKVRAHSKVTDNDGCIALKRGPMVYCIESVDYPGRDIYYIALSKDSEIVPEYRDDSLGEVVVLKGEGMVSEEESQLYFSGPRGMTYKVELTAVPYYAWANREPGAMRIWLPIR